MSKKQLIEIVSRIAEHRKKELKQEREVFEWRLQEAMGEAK